MSVLSDAISEMRNMRESYDQIGAAAEAYNAGKPELAANITSKGVQASATETLPELAAKVAQIAQTETILDGGEVMAAQQFGDGALWNLYQVLADMKTRFMGTGDYSALIVCEYYKEYDSLQLQGADAYYTCDGDLYEYASPTHVWHDADNGKMNRWVAFLYRDEGARLDITNTAISPRSMYIGGHIGTIKYFVNGRLTELVSGVEDTDVVNLFDTAGFSQEWNKSMVLRGVKNLFDKANPSGWAISVQNSGTVVLKLDSGSIVNTTKEYNVLSTNAKYVRIDGIKTLRGHDSSSAFLYLTGAEVVYSDIEEYYGVNFITLHQGSALKNLILPNSRAIASLFNLIAVSYTNTNDLNDVVVGELVASFRFNTWNPTNFLADATKKARLIDNIKNHILARVSDATGGTQLVFTVSLNMYNNIASEQIEWQGETMSLADAFLTKNWRMAGA